MYVFYKLNIKTNFNFSFQTWEFSCLFQVFILILLYFQDGGGKKLARMDYYYILKEAEQLIDSYPQEWSTQTENPDSRGSVVGKAKKEILCEGNSEGDLFYNL